MKHLKRLNEASYEKPKMITNGFVKSDIDKILDELNSILKEQNYNCF